MLETIKKSFLSWIIISRTIIISLLWFTVYAWSFDWLNSMSQTWYNLVNLKLNWVYTSWKMCTSDASWQIHCITDIPSWNVPTWAVMAFNWTNCPTWWTIADWSWDEKNTSWANTTLDLRWEFIRWLDNGRWIDNTRVLRSNQSDSLKSHKHPTNYSNWYWFWGSFWPNWTSLAQSTQLWNAWAALDNTLFWDTETRPRNVALLYCVKL